MNTTEIGRLAEERARTHLESKGWTFEARNFRTPLGEVDLILWDGETLVFVEVRTRSNEAFGRGFETVTKGKQKKIIQAALGYVKSKGLTKVPLRFDVVSLGPRGIDHIPNAFSAPEGRYTL